MTKLRRTLLPVAVFAAVGSMAAAQTVLNANALAQKSSGIASGTDWTLNANGYVGTYITLAHAGDVTFNLQASGNADAGVAPRMNLVVDDSKASFDVTSGFNNYTQTISLPAGTHFVRTEFGNDQSSAAARTLTVRSLGITGATVSNNDTSANAHAAANTYIDNYRKGNARVTLTGPGGVPLLAGTPVNAKMVRNAFNFGGTVSGISNNDSKDMLQTNPAAGTEAYKFQQFINANFNTIVPSNAGKWSSNEATQNSVNMTLVDKQLAYAQSHNMNARMHNLIWGSGATSGSQQPAWVNTLIASAAAGNAASKDALTTAIVNRIKYYVGTTGNRSQKYIEIDGLNESLHNPAYWNIYGAAGIADIYNKVNAALASTGAKARIDLNEWNVLQFSPSTVTTTGAGVGSDQYANWYRQNVDDVRDAGGAVTGIGIQYYANVTQTGGNAHSAATIQKALQNLSVENLPITMAEFGLASGTTKADSQNLGPQVLEDSLRMFYGNANATTFMIWGWWDVSAAGTAYPPAALLDNSNGNNALTPMGTRWQQLMAAWSTNLTPTVAADGTISFNGYYGDYNIGGQNGFSNLTFAKGANDSALQLAAPPTWSFWKATNDGAFDATANWTNGVPGGSGTTAHFAAASAPRIVAINSTVTLGQLNFDGPNAYTISGTGMLALDAIAGEAALNVISGSHEIDVPITLADDAHFVIAQPASSLTVSHLVPAPMRMLTKKGAGTFIVDHLELAALVIESGKVAVTDSAAVNHVGALTIGAGATLDIGGSSWRVDGATPAVRGLLQSGRNGGTWNGTGITSSIATTDMRLAVGYVADDSGVSFRLTYDGDATLDGIVNFDDLLVLAQHYGMTDTATWADGDSTYDGAVDFDDLLVLAQNYGSSLLAPSSANPSFASDWALAVALVPEPTSLALILCTAGTLRRSRDAGPRTGV